MSETRAVLIRLAAQHDINGMRFGAFLDALEHNLDSADATNVQEVLRSVLAPGYTPVYATAGHEAEADAEAAADGPHVVYLVVRGSTADDASSLDGIFDIREDAFALCKVGADSVVAFDLNRDYTAEDTFEVWHPAISPDPQTVTAPLLQVAQPAGDETTPGAAGNDASLGGPGDDSLPAPESNDTIVAGAGNDSIPAGDGNDTVTDQPAK